MLDQVYLFYFFFFFFVIGMWNLGSFDLGIWYWIRSGVQGLVFGRRRIMWKCMGMISGLVVEAIYLVVRMHLVI